MSKNFYMEKIGKKAKIASSNLSILSVDKKNAVLKQQFYNSHSKKAVLKSAVRKTTVLKAQFENCNSTTALKNFKQNFQIFMGAGARGCGCRIWLFVFDPTRYFIVNKNWVR